VSPIKRSRTSLLSPSGEDFLYVFKPGRGRPGRAAVIPLRACRFAPALRGGWRGTRWVVARLPDVPGQRRQSSVYAVGINRCLSPSSPIVKGRAVRVKPALRAPRSTAGHSVAGLVEHCLRLGHRSGCPWPADRGYRLDPAIPTVEAG